MQDHPIPTSGVKQNRLFGRPKLAVKYGSKEFREAKAKVPRKRKKPRKRSVFKASDVAGNRTLTCTKVTSLEPDGNVTSVNGLALAVG